RGFIPIAKSKFDQVGPELVMPSRHRSMRCEHAALAHLLGGLGKTDLLSFNYFARQLQCQKRRVTFVKMKDGRLHSELAQQSYAAHSQHHLLHQTRFAISAV